MMFARLLSDEKEAGEMERKEEEEEKKNQA
jgi:hypothetical protein